MKAEKANTGSDVGVKAAGSRVNLFQKLIEDKGGIIAAIKNGEHLSKLKGIKVVRPI